MSATATSSTATSAAALEERVEFLEARVRTLMYEFHKHAVLVIGSEGLSRETMDEADLLGPWTSVQNTLIQRANLADQRRRDAS